MGGPSDEADKWIQKIPLLAVLQESKKLGVQRYHAEEARKKLVGHHEVSQARRLGNHIELYDKAMQLTSDNIWVLEKDEVLTILERLRMKVEMPAIVQKNLVRFECRSILKRSPNMTSLDAPLLEATWPILQDGSQSPPPFDERAPKLQSLNVPAAEKVDIFVEFYINQFMVPVICAAGTAKDALQHGCNRLGSTVETLLASSAHWALNEE